MSAINEANGTFWACPIPGCLFNITIREPSSTLYFFDHVHLRHRDLEDYTSVVPRITGCQIVHQVSYQPEAPADPGVNPSLLDHVSAEIPTESTPKKKDQMEEELRENNMETPGIDGVSTLNVTQQECSDVFSAISIPVTDHQGQSCIPLEETTNEGEDEIKKEPEDNVEDNADDPDFVPEEEDEEDEELNGSHVDKEVSPEILGPAEDWQVTGVAKVGAKPVFMLEYEGDNMPETEKIATLGPLHLQAFYDVCCAMSYKPKGLAASNVSFNL